MRTEKQIEASRLNGATATNDATARPYPHDFPAQRSASGQGPVTDAGKLISAANSAFSTGPRTPEGKARSARNAEKWQVLANSVALPAERNEEFQKLLHDYRDALRPVGFLEERVVETITVSDWHRRRCWVVGMATVAHATVLQRESSDDFTRKFSQDYGATQTALAIGNLVDHGRSLEFFRRSEAGHSREYRHARKELKELQTDRRKHEQAILDDGGDSLDFECYVDDEKCSEQTEPNESTSDVPEQVGQIGNLRPIGPSGLYCCDPVLGANDQTSGSGDIRDAGDIDLSEPPTTATSEKIAEPTEPNTGIDFSLSPADTETDTDTFYNPKRKCGEEYWGTPDISARVPIWAGLNSLTLTNPGASHTPPCDSDNIDS